MHQALFGLHAACHGIQSRSPLPHSEGHCTAPIDSAQHKILCHLFFVIASTSSAALHLITVLHSLHLGSKIPPAKVTANLHDEEITHLVWLPLREDLLPLPANPGQTPSSFTPEEPHLAMLYWWNFNPLPHDQKPSHPASRPAHTPTAYLLAHPINCHQHRWLVRWMLGALIGKPIACAHYPPSSHPLPHQWTTPLSYLTKKSRHLDCLRVKDAPTQIFLQPQRDGENACSVAIDYLIGEDPADPIDVVMATWPFVCSLLEAM
ncbi:hypothetical protein BDK51DRAFT_28557 [Blyttiomyces helicus]|uniref:Uncharacterized protein n=1 Tax=Blyttiomyces helicus TaxID=388810 RepID=A0A4V1IS35_9FUNG|nr:hypothetical protein BDK51DRAFT_28557 [Blyttiomyces helicus]|eukprot:RKO92177.1 hypothetical protein BDK51DRAFT_28557 [Blyttiomyces helicus]